jgi:hypothetical protein
MCAIVSFAVDAFEDAFTTKERCDEIRGHVVIPRFMRTSFANASTTRILVSANKGRFGTSSTSSQKTAMP